MEQLEFSYISDGNVKWYNHFWNLSQFLLKINASICPTDPISRYLSKRSGNIMFTQRLFTNFIHNSSKLETTLISLENEMDIWYVYTMECYTAVKMNELLIRTTVGGESQKQKNQTQ